MVAAAVLGAGVLGAGASIFGAQTGARAQRDAAQQANQVQMAGLQMQEADLAPYVGQGVRATNMLNERLPALTAPINLDEATLQGTPGYQFTRDQGLRAVQNSATSRGLGVSGAALRGAADYTTGLADTTYGNQFERAQTNRTTEYNMLAGQEQIGANAAARAGSGAIQVAGNVGQNLVGAGTAQAAANVASGNAFSNLGNSVTSAYLLRGLNNGDYFGGTARDYATAGQGP